MSVLDQERKRPATLTLPREQATPRARPRARGLSFGNLLIVALESLARNKTRTFLATLGIIVGVGCVITMLGLAEGTRQEMLERVRKLGSNLLSVRPTEARRGSVSLGAGTRDSLRLSDWQAVQEKCPLVVRAAPRISQSTQVKYRDANTRAQVMGITNDYLTIRHYQFAQGRGLTDRDVATRARVCVLGPESCRQLFGTRPPVGERIQIQGQKFLVVGLLKPREPNWDDNVWVPVSTAMNRLFALDYIEAIEAEVVDEKSLQAGADQITALLRSRHRLRESEQNDFEIRNQQDALDTAAETSRILTVLLAGIASVSLLVGGIGIMNIMLVSVTERTREIGIRRAIGARAGDVLRQFLVEALVMCGLGACLGIGFGLIACRLGALYAGWPILITATAVALPCGFSIAIGLFFGLYPAVRAANLSPLAALRYD